MYTSGGSGGVPRLFTGNKLLGHGVMGQLLSEIKMKRSCTVNLWHHFTASRLVLFIYILAESPTATTD